jgi:hypothetical protein
MGSAWIDALEMLEHGLHFAAQHAILFLKATAHINLISHAFSVAPNSISAVLQIFDMFNGCIMMLVNVKLNIHILDSIPFVRISHLLDFPPGEFGSILLSSSKSDFISLRRLRSAILWLTRSSGVRL